MQNWLFRKRKANDAPTSEGKRPPRIASAEKKAPLGKQESENNAEATGEERLRGRNGEAARPSLRDAVALLSVGHWMDVRREYVRRREKEKHDLDVYQALADGSHSTLEYYLLIVLSCVIATVGLIQGSAAVIIGAMIIAPLMTPILAASLAIIWGDLTLLRTALFSLVKGVVLAIAISALISVAVPFGHFSAEIVSRTRPSAFDIIVALAAGALAAYGYANRKVSNALVGIAIAVALMPPLCTVGIGIGRFDSAVAEGAGLLFAINLVSISLAGAIVFWIMKIHPLSADSGEVKRRAIWQVVLSLVVLGVIAVPVGFYMKSGYELDHAQAAVRSAVFDVILGGNVISMDMRPAKGGGYTLSFMLAFASEPSRAEVDRIVTLIREMSPIVQEVDVTYVKSISFSGG